MRRAAFGTFRKLMFGPVSFGSKTPKCYQSRLKEEWINGCDKILMRALPVI